MRKGFIRACAAFALALVISVTAAVGFAVADTITNMDEDGTLSAVNEEQGIGLAGFIRMQTGTNKTYNGDYCGYVYALGSGSEKADYVTVLATDDKIFVYVPAEVAQAMGIDVADPSSCQNLIALLELVDDEASNGGTRLNSLNAEYVFTSDPEVVDGDRTYTFNYMLEEGFYYAGVLVDGADSSRGVTRFCDSFRLAPADQLDVAAASWFDNLRAFLNKVDYRPLWVSIKTSLVALIFIFLLGLIAAWRSMHVKSRWKSLLDSIFTIPMVLPPTVCGFILLVIFGKSSGIGRFLIDHGIALVFTWPAAVIAAVVVGFPLMYRTVLGAFEALDVNMLDAARTLGWSEGHIFRRLMLPLAWPSIAAGTVLAFARAMGEFGATLFFAGNYAGVTQTMPIAIYFAWMGGSTNVAVFWVFVIIVISFLVILIINLYSHHVQKFRRAGASGIDEDMELDTDVSALEEAIEEKDGAR